MMKGRYYGMEYMQIKGLERAVSKVVLGSGGAPTGFRLDQQELFDEIVDVYFEAGGNMIDTSRMYGWGVSEKLTANWIHKRKAREKMFVTNKCCSPYRTQRKGVDTNCGRVRPEIITEDLMCSLDNMEFEYIDCYLLHRDDENIPVAELMDRLEYHREHGLIKAYGVSNWSTERIYEAIAYCYKMRYQGLSVNEPAYSLATVLESCFPNTVYINDEEARVFTDMGLPVFAFSPLGGGFFAGNFFKKDAVVSERMRRSYVTDQNMEKFRRAELLAAEHETDAPTIALSYISSQDLLLAPIIGTKQTSTCKSCLNAVSMRLAPSEIEYLSLRRDAY